MTNRFSSMVLAGIVPAATFFAAAEVAHADSNTWGWNSPPTLANGEAALGQEAWQEQDGSTGHVLALAEGEIYSLADHAGDTKAVVIQGRIEVAGLTVETAGYATIPSASIHQVTCVSDEDCLTYLEVESTLGQMELSVLSTSEIPWLDVPNTGGNVSLAWVWGDADSQGPSSFFLRFQPGFPGFQHGHTHGYQGVVLQGDYSHWEPQDAERASLPAGTTFWQEGGHTHDDACGVGEGVPCIAYFRIEDAFDVFPAE